MRVLVDRKPPSQRYLILGSASRALIRQSSETLAGRIAYLELPPFTAFEAGDLPRLWLRGRLSPGVSRALRRRQHGLAKGLRHHLPWSGTCRPLGIDFAANTMRRFWMMLAHWHGNVFNASDLARSLDVSPPTVKRYLDILDGTFMIRTLRPWYANLRKRQVKSPKIYFRDAGILHALLNLPDPAALHAHPALGASWEGFALEQVIRICDADAGECYFWAAHTQAELDLLIVRGAAKTAFEFKYSSAPKVTRSMHSALADLDLDRITIVYPGNDAYPLSERVRVAGLGHLARETRD